MNLLKRARAERGLTVRSLATLAGVNAATLSDLENDHRKAHLATLGKLARALEIPLDDLLFLTDETAPDRGRKGQQLKKQRQQLQAPQRVLTPPMIDQQAPPQEPIPPAPRTITAQPVPTALKTARNAKTSAPTSIKKAKKARPLFFWPFFEDGRSSATKYTSLGQVRGFVGEITARESQRARIYEAATKQEAYDAHQAFIKEWHNARVEWPQKIEVVKVGDQGKHKDGPASCTECGKLALEGMFLCEEHAEKM